MTIVRRAVTAGVVLLLALVAGLPGAATTPASAAPASAHQLRPVVDVDYLYRQLWFMSTHYLQRLSGFDGDPRNLGDSMNLPPEVNGWQEFYAYWKQQMTSTDAMGPLAEFAHVSDHYFVADGPSDSDVREVTIPGSVCPGRRVLLAAHPDATPGLNTQNGSAYDDTSGVTMGMAEFQALLRWYAANRTWPTRTLKIGLFDAEELGLLGSEFYARTLLPKGPQGRYVMVANMDQNGMEYPAYHLGTAHFTNDPTGGSGPWRTNINASPLKANDVYSGKDWDAIRRNLPAIRHFRDALNESVRTAFSVLGHRYGFGVPLENPAEFGSTRPAYTEADRAAYSPVVDDNIGRTDQVPFVALGIPGFGVLGAYDSTDNEHPYPNGAPSGLGIPQYAGYDTPRDTIQHLNLMASGLPSSLYTGDPAFPDRGTEELRRALELPATWTTYLVSRPEYGGASPRPAGPVAYFETDPVKPSGATPVTFDGGFSADPSGGGLTYAWTFGDGHHANGAVVQHTFSGSPFADVRLVVVDRSGRVGTYRQAVSVGGSTSAPRTPACGHLTPDEARSVLRANRLPIPAGLRRHAPRSEQLAYPTRR